MKLTTSALTRAIYRALRVIAAGAIGAGLTAAQAEINLIDTSKDVNLVVVVVVLTAGVAALAKWLRDVGVLPPTSLL